MSLLRVLLVRGSWSPLLRILPNLLLLLLQARPYPDGRMSFLASLVFDCLNLRFLESAPSFPSNNNRLFFPSSLPFTTAVCVIFRLPFHYGPRGKFAGRNVHLGHLLLLDSAECSSVQLLFLDHGYPP